MFFDPNVEAIVETLPHFAGEHPGKYPPIRYGDYLAMRLAANYPDREGVAKAGCARLVPARPFAAPLRGAPQLLWVGGQGWHPRRCLATTEIGRATRRDRVWQHELNSVVAVSL